MQGGQGPCPRSRGQSAQESGLEPGSLAPGSKLLSLPSSGRTCLRFGQVRIANPVPQGLGRGFLRYFTGRPALSGSLCHLFALKLRAGCCVGTTAEVIMRHPLTGMDRGESARRNQGGLPGGAWPWGVVGLGAGWELRSKGPRQREARLQGAVALGQPGTRDPRCCCE